MAVGGSGGTIKDFFAPPSVNKSMEDLRDRSSVDFSSNTSWVVDMILSLHQDDTKIAEYMEEHCEAFKFDPRVGIATQKQHNIHQGYIDKVLAFMEEACDGLNIDPDDFVRAVRTLFSFQPIP